MNTVFLVVAIAFVVIVLGLVAYALYELSPLGRHVDRYRDSLTGRRRFESPRLD